tara:strand:+ start:10209 stop:11285 length:1077 start_codon:yes stop_codon:yes gene_type:complete
VKIALVTDTHWGARNDSLIFLEYFHRFYDNVFFPYLRENNISTVIHLGDIVDRRKYINYNILRALKDRFILQLKSMDVALHVIIGNHDVPFRNTNEVNSMRELFGGTGYPEFYDETTELDFDGCKILLVPWINNNNYQDTMTKIKGTQAQVLFGHLEIDGFAMMPGIFHEGGLQKNLFKDFDVVASGHFHHRSSDNNIHYLGCPYEINWSDYNQQKGFHVFDTTTRELTFIQNPYKMFYKVWYDDEQTNYDDYLKDENRFDDYIDANIKVIVQNKNNPDWFDLFMDKLYKANPSQVSIVDDHKNLDKATEEDIIDEAEDTMTILQNYVEGMDVDVDKKKLTGLLSSLYTEAINMDHHI